MGRLVCIEGQDSIELHGYLEDAGRDILLMHYHGLAGNFYENKFIHSFVERAPRNGISFLSLNTRAHDHFSDAHFRGSSKALRRGAAHSKLHEIRSDLLAWISFAINAGFRSIVLQGHSAGAVAIANLLIQIKVPENIMGIVFASPTDMVGLQIMTHGETTFQELLSLARRYIFQKEPKKMMPEVTLPGYLFDAETYLDLFEPGGEGDLFAFRSIEKLARLRIIGRPILAFFGGGEEVCSMHVSEALDQLRKALMPDIRMTYAIVNGAPHSYRNYEKEVLSLVLNWLNKL